MERSNPYRIKSEHRSETDAGIEVDLTMDMGYVKNTVMAIG